jgi:hypothetical protein
MEKTELWHVYKDPYSPTDFNPCANGRFAARTASPPKAMLYAGSTPDCVLWETLLRDVVPQEHHPRYSIDMPAANGYHIARLGLKNDVCILDLSPLGLRRLLGGDKKQRDRISVLTIVPKYPATHVEAMRLLKKFPDAAGLSWISRQTGKDRAYVFYEPPMSSGVVAVLETIALDSSGGRHLIDQALARAGMRRLDSSALAEELEPELPPDLDSPS